MTNVFDANRVKVGYNARRSEVVQSAVFSSGEESAGEALACEEVYNQVFKQVSRTHRRVAENQGIAMANVVSKWVIGLILLGVAAGTMAEGDPRRGKQLVAVCVACHGEDGNSLAGAFPSIAGQHESYLYKQLKEIQNGNATDGPVDDKFGSRPAPLMMGQLAAMSDQDLQDIAAHYAGQQASGGAADPELVEAGEAIYKSGIGRKQIAACSACHSPTGQGNGPAKFPMLAGQWPEYTEAQLKAFRSGERMNDGDSQMMRLIARDMHDDEIKAVASYIYGLR